MQFSILDVGHYTKLETLRQQSRAWHLGLTVSGLDYIRYFTPAGVLAGEYRSGQPALTLLPPGASADFQFNRKRENWVIKGIMEGVSAAPGSPGLRVAYDGVALPLAYCRKIGPERALDICDRFVRIQELWLLQTPSAQLAAELCCCAVLAEFFSDCVTSSEEQPVERFRHAIDEDVSFRKSLAHLSREAGGSPGHLRKAFLEKYKITPGEYRARRRLSRILALLDAENMSFKEIAAEVGMRHVTHLNCFLRERCRATPTMLQRQNRGV